ncbi:MAG TPA: helix-turn-helix transcriptional regulator [Clostridia bacterium]|nr:helix-turn-helix transcriptional regulator [Clostridia bacterium]
MITAGQQLRNLRERLGFTIRDVEAASLKIAALHKLDEFGIPLSRLSDIETKGIVPSIYRLYSLSIIYRCDLRELLCWYGVDVNATAADLGVSEPPRSHKVNTLQSATIVQMPTSLDPGFDQRRTANLGRMIEQWGMVPVQYLSQLSENDRYSYGYIGSEDFTMYPLLLPGCFVQIDETKNKVQEGVWRSEYERPIYFVETRERFICCWCGLAGDKLILQPHPLSPESVRTLKQPQEAEVIGQVVGIAMRLGECFSPAHAPVRTMRELPT